MILLKNVRLFLPGSPARPGWLAWAGKTIARIGWGEAPSLPGAEYLDGRGLSLLPGFIDVHVHGALGADTMDASPESLLKMARFYAAHGVTGFLPTTWTDTPERIRAALETVAGLCGSVSDGAAVLGAHLEGPYINPDKRGAQRLEDVRRAAPDEALPLLDLGVIRLLSLAPEFDDNLWLIEACVKRGITVSIAHTAASYEQVLHAANAGVTHATHTFNAMTPLSHREPGTVGAVLTLPQIRCELIADNIHVHPAAMRILFAAKGADGVILITDAVRAAGMPDGTYHLDARSVVVKDGAVRLPDGTLAGSVLTMDRALRNLIQATGCSLEQLWQTSSLNAARSIGLSHRKGSLEVGKDADLVLVDEAIRVYLTVSEGAIIYRQPM